MKVPALTRNAHGSPIVEMMTPAIAGPMMRLALKTALFRLIALGRRSRPTISVTKA